MPTHTDKQRDAAIKKQDRGYRSGVDTVPDAEWVSQFEAARELRIGLKRVGALIFSRQLVPVHNARCQAGVSRESVTKQRDRRVDAGVVRRTWLFATDAVKVLVNGIS